jgi:hypothetical protein
MCNLGLVKPEGLHYNSSRVAMPRPIAETEGSLRASTEMRMLSLKWPGGKGQVVEEKLKVLMQELGNAINESLSDSDRIAAAIGEIRRAGYDVFLVLEATIGFNKRDEDEESGVDTDEETSTAEAVTSREPKARLRWTSQDQKFLRALKISVDEESR